MRCKIMYLAAALMLILSTAFSAEIVVKEPMTEVPGDLALIQSPLRDMSGNWCALLKINTDLAPFNSIQSNMTPMKTVNKTGEVWVYLSPGERRLYFTKTGYARLIYDVPLNMESNKVYSLKLIGSGINLSKALPVTIKVTPADAVVTIADTLRCDISKPVMLEPGKYDISISKSGYSTITSKIEVKADRIFFEYDMEKEQDIPLEIYSTPTGAEVYIDEVKLGTTPISTFYPSGTYNLKLTKEWYADSIERAIIKAPAAKLNYTLKPNFATLTVISKPETDMGFTLNSKKTGLTTPYTYDKILPGRYVIQASKQYFQTDQQEVDLVAGDKKTVTLTSNRLVGDITVNSTPQDGMDIWMDGVATGQKTPHTFTNLNHKKYSIEAKLPYYITDNPEINLVAGEKKTVTLTSSRIVGDITVNSSPRDGMDIWIDGESSGQKTPHTFVNLEPRTYTILAKNKMYLSDTLSVVLKAGETVKASLTPIANFATLTIICPQQAEVYLNGNKITNRNNIQLEPMQVTIKVTMPKAADIVERVVLKRGDNQTLTLKPSVASGTIQIAVLPSDAEITLTGDAGESYGSTGTKIFSDVPIGTYQVKVKKTGYKTYSETVNVVEGAKITKSIILSEGSDIEFMVYVEGGTFTMGDTAGGGYSNEKPTHSVSLSSFYIGKYEVTQKQWQEVMGSNPSNWKGDALPVECVTWYDCIEFCNKLSVKEGLTPCYSGSVDKITCDWTANGYRLPTEAEWEYAAKGGKQSKGYKYAGSNDPGTVAWYEYNSGDKTHAVGGKKANKLGIYDMTGNVWEWNWDQYGAYSSGAQTNPRGSGSGSSRVLRGGSWDAGDSGCRVSGRNDNYPVNGNDYYGLRLFMAAQ